MASLNIRDFPPKLLEAMKVEAARRGITLQELAIESLTFQYAVAVGTGFWEHFMNPICKKNESTSRASQQNGKG